MAAVESTMLELNTQAPDFTLPIVTGGTLNFNNYAQKAKGTVVCFICNHCPFVKHINKQLVEIANKYIQQGISFVAISSNDVVNYPADAPDKMAEVVRVEGYPFPYLYDESQEVAKLYEAACTPDFYLFDGDQKLVYRGQFDSSRPGNGQEVTGEDLERAIVALMEGEDPVSPQIPSIGCNIKWKVGNAPEYFGV